MNNHMIHVCLISEQLLPNHMPVLMDRPSVVYLVTSSAMENQAVRFQEILHAENIETRNCTKVPDTGLTKIIAEAGNIYKKIVAEFPGYDIILNATGGTKLMSMGFAKAFQNAAGVARIIYTDTGNDLLEVIYPEDGDNTIPVPANLMDFDAYFKVQGMSPTAINSDSMEWRQKAIDRMDVTEFFARKSGREFSNFLSNMNRMVAEAVRHDRLSDPEQSIFRGSAESAKRTNVPQVWVAAFKALAKKKMIEWDGGPKIRFLDVESAKYLGGLWLEELTWHSIRQLQPAHLGSGVLFQWITDGKNGSENEIDALLVHRNRMLVIECKTARFDKATNRAQDAINKLGTVARNAGGVLGKSLMLLSNPPSDALLMRAQMLRVDVIYPDVGGGSTLQKKLEQYVSQWMGSGEEASEETNGDKVHYSF